MKIVVINGPNMNLLGKREPAIYGSETLQDLENYITKEAKELNIEVEFFQSNHEGEIVDRIHKAMEEKKDGIILNAGAFTHYSYAIRDAIKGTGVRTVEVHMSNVYTRKNFVRDRLLHLCVWGKLPVSDLTAILLHFIC